MYMHSVSVAIDEDNYEIVVKESIMLGMMGEDTYVRFPKEQAIIVANEILKLAEKMEPSE